MFHNTIVSTRTDRTTLIRLSTNDETSDFRNNIVYNAAGGNALSLVDQSGILNLTHNWFQPGKTYTFGSLTGVIHDDGTSLTGPSPGFVSQSSQDFHLTAASPARDAGTALHPAVLPDHDLLWQYGKPRSAEIRPTDATIDLGAFEYQAAVASLCDLNADTQVNVVDLQRLINTIIGPGALAGAATDLNSDGEVNELDMQLLIDVILGSSACPA